jgi:hypothetical protein
LDEPPEMALPILPREVAMNRTLRFGARGDDVAELQTGLNLLPSALPRLSSDGFYGTKTTGRVQEFQRTRALVPDGITGPQTWQVFLDLLAHIQQGNVPTLPGPVTAVDPRRPVVLIIAQQHFGVVDFQQIVGGRPRGVDFLIEMFRVAAKITLTEANFRNPTTKVWHQEPWVNHPNEPRKSWCGIFCVYCYIKAGFTDVSWSLVEGRPVPRQRLKLNSFSSQFVANVRQADIGCVNTRQHHFLIESVDGSGPKPGLSTIDGNQVFGRIQRRSDHRFFKDNFNYYSIM